MSLAHIDEANFDPEFYKLYENDIQLEFKKQSPTSYTMSHKLN